MCLLCKQSLETFNIAATTLQDLLRKTLKTFILLNFLRLRPVKLFWILHTETSLILIKKGHYFLEISAARPEASDPAVLREPAKTSVEDLGAAAKPRDINKNDCQEQHGEIFYPGRRRQPYADQTHQCRKQHKIKSSVSRDMAQESSSLVEIH